MFDIIRHCGGQAYRQSYRTTRPDLCHHTNLSTISSKWFSGTAILDEVQVTDLSGLSRQIWPLHVKQHHSTYLGYTQSPRTTRPDLCHHTKLSTVRLLLRCVHKRSLRGCLGGLAPQTSEYTCIVKCMLNVLLFFCCAVPSRGIANLNSPVICF